MIRCQYTSVIALTCALLGIVLSAGGALAEDPTTSRRVTGTEHAAGATITINQVDTSAYPKVMIFSTVLRDGKPVEGLTANDFRVREDEVDQEPLKVEPKLTPLSAVVTLDTSGSMKKALSSTQEAAIKFIDILNDVDTVQVIGFSREVRQLTSPSANRQAAKDAIRSTVARGDTALYDALFHSVESLKQQPGRKAIVLLSDGVDDDGTGKQLSKHTVDEALKLAAEVNVPIFTIGLGAEIDESVLKRAAAETGGSYFRAPDAGQLEGLYKSIGMQLSGQYNIYYTSNLPSDGTVHRIQLSHGELRSQKEFRAPQNLVAEAAKPAAAPAPVPVSVPLSPSGEPKFSCSAAAESGTGESIVKALAVSEPGKALRVDSWKVFSAVPDSLGEVKQITSTGAPEPKLKLLPGKYRLEAKLGFVIGDRTVDVGANQHCIAEVLMPPGGSIRLEAVEKSGGQPVKVDNWKLLEAGPSELSEGKHLASTGADNPQYVFKTGKYVAIIKRGFITTRHEFEVRGGDARVETVILPPSATVQMVAVSQAGGTPLSGVAWKLMKGEANAFGEREQLEYTGTGQPRWIVPPGKYFVQVKKRIGQKEVTSGTEFEVSGGDARKVEVVLAPDNP